MTSSTATLLTEPASTGVNAHSESGAPASLASATAAPSTELVKPLIEPVSPEVDAPSSAVEPYSLASATAAPST